MQVQNEFYDYANMNYFISIELKFDLNFLLNLYVKLPFYKIKFYYFLLFYLKNFYDFQFLIFNFHYINEIREKTKVIYGLQV